MGVQPAPMLCALRRPCSQHAALVAGSRCPARARHQALTLVVGALLLLGGFALTARAHAAFPGRDGKIAFCLAPGETPSDNSCGIYTINPDGSGRRNLT